MSKDMTKYVCSACGYVYDPKAGEEENGIKAGTPFNELSEDYACPLCGLSKEYFDAEE